MNLILEITLSGTIMNIQIMNIMVANSIGKFQKKLNSGSSEKN